jgi:hypothetical protein
VGAGGHFEIRHCEVVLFFAAGANQALPLYQAKFSQSVGASSAKRVQQVLGRIDDRCHV